MITTLAIALLAIVIGILVLSLVLLLRTWGDATPTTALLALANVIATLVCILFARYLAWFSTAPIHILAPFVVIILILAAYQATRDWGDLIILAVLGLLGWFMKQFEFSRPPLLIGFVLGLISERYLWLSVQRYDMAWVLRPWVIGIGVLIIASLIWGLRRQKKKATQEIEGG